MEEKKIECISRITATNRPRRKWANIAGARNFGPGITEHLSQLTIFEVEIYALVVGIGIYPRAGFMGHGWAFCQ